MNTAESWQGRELLASDLLSAPNSADLMLRRNVERKITNIRIRGAPMHQLHITEFSTLQNNPQHLRVLANEMFATRLGQWLGLPMPSVEVIEVSDWLIANSPDMRVDVGGLAQPCSSGLQLASLYPDINSQVFDYLPEGLLTKITNLRDYARCLVLDKWTGNCDGRQAIFTRRPRGKRYAATFIDQGYCFNAGEWAFPDTSLRGVYSRNCVYEHVTGWESFEPALSRAEEADLIDIWRCAQQIPPEWYGHDHDGLNQLVDSLYRRRGSIRDLITAFRESSRNPFPNWAGVATAAEV